MADLLRDRLQRSLGAAYDLTREIGRGGMASVYLAHDRKHGRAVAIKVLLPELTATLGADRFLREIRLVARLQHPHILPLFDSGEAAGLLYFVMPFVDGESLRARLDREGALTLDETIRLVRPLADALDYAHARGVVHRDVKPENILISGRLAFLADFGVAHLAASGAADTGTLTSVGTTLGTPAYMSPEQAAAERDVDGRSDVYSLGCVCHEAVAGEPPFRGASALAVISQHLVRPPPPLVGARDPVPPPVQDAVARALAKNPADRFGGAGEFVAALERAVVEARRPSPADLRLRAAERQQEARQRVLVLEFANLAAATDADWLSTGIAETVSADLNKIAGIRVVGQDPATRRRVEGMREGRLLGHEQAVELARSAGARWVVWGAFQKFGARIRITTHVAGSEVHDALREEKIDGVMDDIFTLQDRIVTVVADALRIQLTSGEVEQICRPETTHLTAYEHYARGFRARIQMGKESARAAEAHFRAAIALDPHYALAYAGLGALHIPMYIATGERDLLEEATALLERAIALDASLAEPYAWLAYMLARQQRFHDAEVAAHQAIALDPRNFDCWYMLGTARVIRACELYEPEALAKAVPPLLRTVRLRPEHFSAYCNLAALYVLRGAYGHAAATVATAVRRELTDTGVRFVGAVVLQAVLHVGRAELADAERLLDRAIARYAGADHVYAEASSAYAHWLCGCVAERRDEHAKALEEFTRAAVIADAHRYRISIGAHWAKAQFGRVRALQRLGRGAEAEQTFVDADAIFSARARFVWTWYLGGSDAEVLYERASALATLDRTTQALDSLRRAADACWADVVWLRHDPAFRMLRDAADVQRICAQAASRAELPSPHGSGGLE